MDYREGLLIGFGTGVLVMLILNLIGAVRVG